MIISSVGSLAQILIVLVLATAAIIIMKRDVRSLIKTYAFQSLLLAAMALLFFVETGILTLLYMAVIILVSKVWVIPHFMGVVQKRLNIQRDVKFHFLSPVTSLLVSIVIILFVYLSFSTLLSELNRFDSSLFFLGRYRRYVHRVHGYDCNIHQKTNHHKHRGVPYNGKRGGFVQSILD